MPAPIIMASTFTFNDIFVPFSTSLYAYVIPETRPIKLIDNGDSAYLERLFVNRLVLWPVEASLQPHLLHTTQVAAQADYDRPDSE